MKRSEFVKTVSAATIVTSLPSFAFSEQKNIDEQKVTKPKALRRGDLIGIVTPGSYITQEELNDSIKNVESLGFKAVYTDKVLEMNGYFSAHDKDRAEDIMKMFSRKDIKAIMCARGGYGCARILPMLDYSVIKNNPKILIGYSDVTALLLGITHKTGLVTFHGPVGISSFNEFTRKYFYDVLVEGNKKIKMTSAADDNPDEPAEIYTLRKGKCSGKLAGGNLSVMVSLIGTEYDIDYTNKIIFIEEIGEEPYRIDRMLTQMIQSGKFKKAKGIALGTFRKCESKKVEPSFENSFSLKEVLIERLASLGIPVAYGLSFGHIKNKFTLPLGISTEFDAGEKTITLLENAVE
ncbi:MAG: LD-carboxypeptidase [Ignavibacteriales bacterium]|nr:MAG: LD-carboxypeptidase [Ignavibacteriales bacterium]